MEEVGVHRSGALLYDVRYEQSPESIQGLELLLDKHPEAIIVGSTIAAMTYPEGVVGLIKDPRCVQRGPGQKFYCFNQFAAFPRTVKKNT